jgi:isopropylmalate/homocitrate/citramalate synthase
MAVLSGLPARATIVEVGPRDGLQNEAQLVPAAAKVAFVEALAAAGLPIVEVTAFVRPDAVPQLADAAEVMRSIRQDGATRFVALVPNLAGCSRALDAGAKELAVFTAASEQFSQRNTRCSIAESLDRIRAVAAAVRAARAPLRAYLSMAWHCPYEGPIAPDTVERLVRELLDVGAWQVSLGDTIGAATPVEVARLLERLLRFVEPRSLALHCHDTRGTALANVLAALQLGISTFDASAGGLGGCPFAPGAAGNLATEALVYMLEGMGIATGVSLPRLAEATAAVEPYVGRLSSRAVWHTPA